MPSELSQIRLTGIQLRRAIEKAGGLFGSKTIAEVIGVNPGTVRDWRQKGTFPAPAIERHRSDGGFMWAGVDVIDWLDKHERWEAARRMALASHKQVMEIRALAQREGRLAHEQDKTAKHAGTSSGERDEGTQTSADQQTS